MGLTGNIVINLYSVSLLLTVLFQCKRKTGRTTLLDKLYNMILYITVAMLATDTMGRFDGRPDTIFPYLNHFGNLITFLLSPTIPMLWLLYVHTQVYQNEKKTRQLLIPCGILLAMHAILVVGTQFNGWLYTIDSQNIYRRGPLYMVSPSILFLCLLYTSSIAFRNRKSIEKRLYNSLLFFPAPPFIAGILHSHIYGVSIMLSSLVLSIIIVYLNIQNRSLITDHLTDVYNRKGFDMHIREMMRGSIRGKAFSAIMLDYNHFKSINDSFGHDMGDKALKESANLLKGCIRRNDFIARYGGDEFIILLETDNKQELEAIVARINHAIDNHNQNLYQPYQMSFSIGYAVYDTSSKPSAEEFVHHLDQMMYKMKQLSA